MGKMGPGWITCDVCSKRHVARYSHKGRWFTGPIYIAHCGDLIAYYSENAVSGLVERKD